VIEVVNRMQASKEVFSATSSALTPGSSTRCRPVPAPRVTRRLLGQLTAQRRLPRPRIGCRCSPDREREVLALVGRGMSNDEIRAAMFLSPATARTHVGRAMTKLGARDRAQLVLADQTGLTTPTGNRRFRPVAKVSRCSGF